MSQPTHEPERIVEPNGCLGIRTSFITHLCPPQFAHTNIDHNLYPPSPSQPSHGRKLWGGSTAASLVDGSWRLDNMYLGVAKDEDKVMAESWQADADGMLLFVSIYSHFTVCAFHVNPNTVDWLVLRCRRGISCCVHTGPSSELPHAI